MGSGISRPPTAMEVESLGNGALEPSVPTRPSLHHRRWHPLGIHGRGH